jgi:DNA polymerase-1
MTILCIDFMNVAHRARSGFQAGDFPVVYNFFRQFKSLVEQFKPTRVYVVLEGRPVKRHQALDSYKANRIVEDDDPRREELLKFFRQKEIVVDILQKYMPVSVVRHPTSEADDTIANLIRRSTSAVEWTVVSSDTDFIQLLQEHDNVRLYNPVRKEFVTAPDYDYVTWKALRGDASDNIPGVPGVGDKTASKIATDPQLLQEFVTRPEVQPIFTRNYDLIRFSEWTETERDEMTSSSPMKDWEAVRSAFETMGFVSVTKEESWRKFTSALEPLFG